MKHCFDLSEKCDYFNWKADSGVSRVSALMLNFETIPLVLVG
jgi:hypothetical protein